ncbi:hypothetical protein F2P81_017918 [Scophthalmus maximus]|uniref:CST complex subunit CTC1 n=1 Tax=Scophthalmus maximus TaxID=52904 RepID=A0A6A4S378_SCOMX|nr:hypothetical protein F2P81_017918 [Scophthalmus maximus]
MDPEQLFLDRFKPSSEAEACWLKHILSFVTQQLCPLLTDPAPPAAHDILTGAVRPDLCVSLSVCVVKTLLENTSVTHTLPVSYRLVSVSELVSKQHLACVGNLSWSTTQQRAWTKEAELSLPGNKALPRVNLLLIGCLREGRGGELRLMDSSGSLRCECLSPSPRWLNHPIFLPHWNYIPHNALGQDESGGCVEVVSSPVLLCPGPEPGLAAGAGAGAGPSRAVGVREAGALLHNRVRGQRVSVCGQVGSVCPLLVVAGTTFFFFTLTEERQSVPVLVKGMVTEVVSEGAGLYVVDRKVGLCLAYQPSLRRTLRAGDCVELHNVHFLYQPCPDFLPIMLCACLRSSLRVTGFSRVGAPQRDSTCPGDGALPRLLLEKNMGVSEYLWTCHLSSRLSRRVEQKEGVAWRNVGAELDVEGEELMLYFTVRAAVIGPVVCGGQDPKNGPMTDREMGREEKKALSPTVLSVSEVLDCRSGNVYCSYLPVSSITVVSLGDTSLVPVLSVVRPPQSFSPKQSFVEKLLSPEQLLPLSTWTPVTSGDLCTVIGCSASKSSAAAALCQLVSVSSESRSSTDLLLVRTTMMMMKMMMKELVLVLACVLSVSAEGLHDDLAVLGCSDTGGEKTYNLDGEELWFADFVNKRGVYPLPSFIDPITFQEGFYQQAEADLQICRSNLKNHQRIFKDTPLELGRDLKISQTVERNNSGVRGEGDEEQLCDR